MPSGAPGCSESPVSPAWWELATRPRRSRHPMAIDGRPASRAGSAGELPRPRVGANSSPGSSAAIRRQRSRSPAKCRSGTSAPSLCHQRACPAPHGADPAPPPCCRPAGRPGGRAGIGADRGPSRRRRRPARPRRRASSGGAASSARATEITAATPLRVVGGARTELGAGQLEQDRQRQHQRDGRQQLGDADDGAVLASEPQERGRQQPRQEDGQPSDPARPLAPVSRRSGASTARVRSR